MLSSSLRMRKSDNSISVSNAPYRDLSAGIFVRFIQLPVAYSAKSSPGFTLRSMPERSNPHGAAEGATTVSPLDGAVVAIIAGADVDVVVLDCPCTLDMQRGVITTKFKAMDEYFTLKMDVLAGPAQNVLKSKKFSFVLN
jgi:hypothetical protein